MFQFFFVQPVFIIFEKEMIVLSPIFEYNEHCAENRFQIFQEIDLESTEFTEIFKF